MIKNLKPREIHSLAPNREIFAPDNGWVPDTLYLVRVAHNRSNPVHEAYLQVGFLNDDGTPGSYTEVWCNTYDIAHELRHVHYLFPVRRLHTVGEGGSAGGPRGTPKELLGLDLADVELRLASINVARYRHLVEFVNPDGVWEKATSCNRREDADKVAEHLAKEHRLEVRVVDTFLPA